MNPLVSIVVCTKNRPVDLRACILSLKKQDYSPFEIIVVDNDAAGTAKAIANAAGVKYVPAPLKPNLPYARNVGLGASKGGIVVYCDDDIEAYDGWLSALISSYREGVGGVGGQVILPENSGLMEEELETSKGVKRMFLKALAFLIDYKGSGKVTNSGQVTGFYGINSVQEVDHMQGCNMSFRKELLEKAGGFDEAQGEGDPFRDDTDASVRVKRLGYALLLNPDAKVFHKLSKMDPRFYRRNYYYRNLEHYNFIFKNHLISGTGYVKFPVQQLAEIFIYAGLALRERNFTILSSSLKGKADGIASVIGLRKNKA